MEQQVIFEKPQPDNKCMADLKKSDKTVQAMSLLTEHEQKIVPKMTAFVVVEHQGECFTVPPHAQVPCNATIVRSPSGALVGIPAVVGG